MKNELPLEEDKMPAPMEAEDESTETPQKESTDYAYVDRFVDSLDEDEKAYLIKKLNDTSSEGKDSETALDEKDFED